MIKRLIVLALIAGSFPCYLQAESFRKSRVDERVELLSVVMRLAGVEEFCKGMIPAYNRKVDDFFAAYREHPVVATARKMKRKYKFRRDAVLNLAIHLKIEGDSVFFDPSLTTGGLDSRSHNELTETFIRELSDFYKNTEARRFFDSERELYRSFGENTDRQVVDTIHTEWFNGFFGWHASDYCVVPTLLIGEYYFYACAIDKEGRKTTYFSIRGFLDQKMRASSDWRLARSAVIRGIAHVYGNPLMDENRSAMKPYVKTIYKRMWSELDMEPYNVTEMVLYEGFARGVEVYYTQVFEGNTTRLLNNQKTQGFYWLESFSDLLTVYADSRAEYKTIRDFMPQIMDFYRELAK